MQQQKTPKKGATKSHGHTPNQNQGRQRQYSKPKVFEPYWTKELVSHGIKQGQLTVGQIRINPKNYKEAYVPQMDGLADIFIDDLEDRNRALNSDEVVVMPYPLNKWRINMGDFDDYQRSSQAVESLRKGPSSPMSHSGADSGGNVSKGDSDDSGPDVVIEESGSDSEQSGAKGKDKSKGIGAVTDTGAQQLESAIGGLQVSDASVRVAEALDKLKKATAQEVPAPSLSKGDTEPPKGYDQHKIMSVGAMRKKGFPGPLAKELFGPGLEETVTHISIGKSLAAKFLQITGKIVSINDKKHSRAASGHIKIMKDKNQNLALFAPLDSRTPRIIIPMAQCPKDFSERPNDYANTLFIAYITEWEDTSKMPKGQLARSLGEAGQIEPETEAMLIEMDVDDSPFSEEVLKCLPQDLPWSIPQSELSSRLDLRKACIFTIDPATARDLDDAVSCEKLDNGNYKIGVHIADVSFFINEGSELDKVAAKRATSVYLVQKVVPMLPRLLCEELCSLNPYEDRLAFSVLWEVSEKGEILEEWFGRSIIRSCVKLSYEHAQGFIDEPDRDWTPEELPPISNDFGVKDILDRILLLNKIAVALRRQRHDKGALRLDQVKLQYHLDHDTGMPSGTSVYQQKDSNRLIEEFMLLANMAVAHRIKSRYPGKAILRRHPAPQNKPLQAMEELCDSLGLKINTSTAASLQESLQHYSGEDDFSLARLQVLVVLISKPMQNARYFCTGTLEDESMYHHYALNVPLYTHFTSPIRRYADIMVHRLLSATQGYNDPPDATTQALQQEASHCNDKKFNAKMASDRSTDMFFALFVKEVGPLEEAGMVMAVLDKSFDVLILKLGVTKRVYLEHLPIMSNKFSRNQKCPQLTLEWSADETLDHRTWHLITLFTMVDCVVYATEHEPLKWSCTIRRPKQEIKYATEEKC